MIELVGHTGRITALAYSPDGTTLASASADGTTRLWDVATGQLKAKLQSPAAMSLCLAFSPDQNLLAVGYGNPVGLVQLWDTDSWQMLERWAANPVVTRGVAFNPNGALLASAGDGGAVRLWRAPSKANNSLSLASARSTSDLVAAVTFSPDDRFVAAVMQRPASVRVWEVAQQKEDRFYRSLNDLSDWGYALAFSSDCERLAIGLEGQVALWNPLDYRPATIWPAHAGAVLGVAFTPDGQTLLTGGSDGLVKFWNSVGQFQRELDWQIGDVSAVTFAPDGLTAAAGGHEKILVWDASE